MHIYFQPTLRTVVQPVWGLGKESSILKSSKAISLRMFKVDKQQNSEVTLFSHSNSAHIDLKITSAHEAGEM